MIASRETILSLLYRIGTIGFSFASVSWLIKDLGPTRYGAWATLVSALMWIQMSDLGVGYVIKNRVAARERPAVLCNQIATAFRLSLLTGFGLCILFVIGGRQLSVVRDHPVEATILYVTAFLALPAMIGTNVLQGLGLARVSFLVSMLQNLAWLGVVIVGGEQLSLRGLAITFAGLWLASNVYLFHRGFRAVGLSVSAFMLGLRSPWLLREVMPLLRVGGAFFVLQLTGLVLFNLGTYLAYTCFSPDAAARYDILNKIFQIPMTLFNVVIAIAWSAVATLLSQRNFDRSRTIHTQLVAASAVGGLLVMVVSLLVVSPFVQAYSHGKLSVDKEEIFWFAALVAIQMLAFSGAVFMNAVERLRIQIAFALTSTLLFLPIFSALQAMGVAAIPLATFIVVMPGAIYFNVYARRHIVAAPRLATQSL